MNRTLFFYIFSLFSVTALLAGCREVPSDRLYALYLDHSPASADWERSLPRVVTVKGGRKHEEAVAVNIDADTVHTTTASCHHGSSLPDPVPVDMRAFYTSTDLYLRLSWPDASRDDAILAWEYDGQTWRNTGAFEDGFGLLWKDGGVNHFTCSTACHIDDFGVRGANFHATNRMKFPSEEDFLDLWNWKAGRTAKYGFADDRYLDSEGMHGDIPGDIFRENSRSILQKISDLEPFSENDAPICDATGEPVDAVFRSPGEMVPGYLTERPTGGRGDVSASSSYESGRWTVVLRRPLDTGDPRDVVFIPGEGSGVAFGLSLMDNTLYEHYASTTQERLVLLKP